MWPKQNSTLALQHLENGIEGEIKVGIQTEKCEKSKKSEEKNDHRKIKGSEGHRFLGVSITACLVTVVSSYYNSVETKSNSNGKCHHATSQSTPAVKQIAWLGQKYSNRSLTRLEKQNVIIQAIFTIIICLIGHQKWTHYSLFDFELTPSKSHHCCIKNNFNIFMQKYNSAHIQYLYNLLWNIAAI